MRGQRALLYFFKDRIGLCLTVPGVNGTMRVKRKAAAQYSGMLDGEFVDASELPSIVLRLVHEVLEGIAVEAVLVEAPAMFCSVSTAGAHEKFSPAKKLTDKDIEEFQAKRNGNTVAGMQEIYRDVMFYKLDGGQPTLSIEGKTVSDLYAKQSIIHTSDHFMHAIQNAFAGTQLKNLRYVSTELARAKYFVPESSRDVGCAFISCDMFSTSLAVAVGDGLADLYTVNAGYAHVLSDLTEVLECDHGAAEDLLDGVILSLDVEDDDIFTVGEFEYNAREVTEIIRCRLDEIAEELGKVLAERESPDKPVQLYFGGAHIPKINGARDAFAKALGRHVRLALCPLTHAVEGEDIKVQAMLDM